MIKPYILIIEAERITSQYYNNIFAKINVKNVYHINNTFEIIPVLERSKPDFIVIDVALLDEEISLNLLDKLHKYKPEIPLAVISSIFLPEIIKKQKTFPNSEFFLKPLNLDNFLSSIIKKAPNLNSYKKNYFLDTIRNSIKPVLLPES